MPAGPEQPTAPYLKGITLKRLLLAALVAVFALLSASPASADTVIIESDTTRLVENAPQIDDWAIYTRIGTPASAAAFVEGPGTAPLGTGSLRFTTATSAHKVFAFTNDLAGTKLADAGPISYAAYRTAGTGNQHVALNVQIDPDGPDGPLTFATLVFEPVYNLNQGAIVNGAWKTWNASGTGKWWSTQPLVNQCQGASTTCQRTMDHIVTNNPNATIKLAGVNQGSSNAGLTTAVDALTMGGTTYDFEANDDADGDGDRDGVDNCVDVFNDDQADADGDDIGDACDPDRDGDGVANGTDNCADISNGDQADADGDGIGTACDEEELPSSAADCKKGRFTMWTRSFKNQGDCVSFVEAGSKA